MKRIKKILFVLGLLVLCTGCTINYDLEIKESEIIENIVVNDTITLGRTSKDILDTYNTWMPVYDNIDNPDLIQDSDDNDGKVDGIPYHQKSKKEITDGYSLTYKYTYPIGEFNHANSVKLAFGRPNFYDGGSYINIRTDNINALCNYDYFESLVVKIKVDLDTYTVEKNNAHKVKGNTYTWKLDRSNCNNSVISMTLNKNNNVVVSTTSASGNGGNRRHGNGLNGYVLYIFLGIVVLVIILGYRWFNQVKERENGVD